MPGGVLCSIDLDTLKMIFPAGAELIHAQLNLWTTANDYGSKSHCEPSKIKREELYPIEPAWPTFYQGQSLGAPFGLNNGDMANNNNIARFPPMKKEKVSTPFVYANSNADFPMTSPSCDSGFSTDSEEYYNDAHEQSSSPSWPKLNHALPMVANYYFQNNNIHLWQFLRELLDNQDKYSFCVRWVDRPQGIFKIEDSHKLAKFWGQRKNRPAMNYDKLSRSLRQYYRKGILKKTARSQRLVYQFLSPYHIC